MATLSMNFEGVIPANISNASDKISRLNETHKTTNFTSDIARSVLVAETYEIITTKFIENYIKDLDSMITVFNIMAKNILCFIRHASQNNICQKITVPNQWCAVWAKTFGTFFTKNIALKWSLILYVCNFSQSGEMVIPTKAPDDNEALANEFAKCIYKYETNDAYEDIEQDDLATLTEQNLMAYYFVPIRFYHNVRNEPLNSTLERISCLFYSPILNAHFGLTNDELPTFDV